MYTIHHRIKQTNPNAEFDGNEVNFTKGGRYYRITEEIPGVYRIYNNHVQVLETSSKDEVVNYFR